MAQYGGMAVIPDWEFWRMRSSARPRLRSVSRMLYYLSLLTRIDCVSANSIPWDIGNSTPVDRNYIYIYRDYPIFILCTHFDFDLYPRKERFRNFRFHSSTTQISLHSYYLLNVKQRWHNTRRTLRWESEHASACWLIMRL